MAIIERIKYIFDFLRKNHDKSVNNLAVYIDNFFHKRKIDIRVDIKSLKENIKENEELNVQRNKDIKDTLEEIKFQIKGYSAKKERMMNKNEFENIEGKKLEFNDENEEDINKDMVIEEEIEKKSNEKEEIKEEEIKNVINEEKEEKIIGRKRLRNEQNENLEEKEIKVISKKIKILKKKPRI